jgi:hypothetical protein
MTQEFDKWEKDKLDHEKKARRFYRKLSVTI